MSLIHNAFELDRNIRINIYPIGYLLHQNLYGRFEFQHFYSFDL